VDHGLLAAVAAIAVAGCSSDSKPPLDPDAGPGARAVTVKINAAEGGSISIPGGATLEIPPGALAEDTRITVKVPEAPTSDARYFVLEPRGLEFKHKVSLKIPFGAVTEPVFTVYQSSANATLNTSSSGSEQSNWRLVEDVTWDQAGKSLSVKLDHFTFINAMSMVHDLAHLVLDIPGHLLNPGDILVNLTYMPQVPAQKGPTWMPGHVGLVTALPHEDPGAQVIVIEAVPSKVKKNLLGVYKQKSGDLYLGARRPDGAPMTVGERIGAVTYAQDQLGKPYSLIGEGNIGTGSFSCVGLVEAALDFVDRGTTPGYQEALAIAPYEMYSNSKAVDLITVRAGQKISIPIYGAVIHPSSQWDPTGPMVGYYQKDQRYTITAELPEGAELKGGTGSYTFEWTPRLEQACTKTCPADGMPYTATFTMTAGPSCETSGGTYFFKPVTITQTLTINLLGHSGVFTISPRTPGQKTTYYIDVEVPPDMEVLHRVFREDDTDVELLDENGALTAEALTPYPNHVTELLYEGTHPTKQSWYRIEWSITNGGTTAVSGAAKTWRYFIDYKLKRWLNEKNAKLK